MSRLRKPLYVDCSSRASVDRDGPALLVRVPGQADQYFPARRLLRVVCRGPVPWSPEALFLCMERSIPVVFTDEDGVVCGVCTGRGNPDDDLASLLDAVVDREDWRERYDAIQRSVERRVVKVALRRAGLPGNDLRPRHARKALRRLRDQVCGRRASAVLEREAQAMARALAAQTLLERGLSGSMLRAKHGPDLEGDLADILEFVLEEPTREIARRFGPHPPSRPVLIEALHRHENAAREVATTWIHRVERSLREILV